MKILWIFAAFLLCSVCSTREEALLAALSQAAERGQTSERLLEEAIMQAAELYPSLKRALEAQGPEEDPEEARALAAQLDEAIAQVARVDEPLALAMHRIREDPEVTRAREREQADDHYRAPPDPNAWILFGSWLVGVTVIGYLLML